MEPLSEAFGALDAIAGAGLEAGTPVDPLVLLGEDQPEDEATFDGRALPDEGDEIELSTEDREELARDLCEQLTVYDSAMENRRDRWDEIEEAYDLVGSSGGGGEIGESESIVSEWLMSLVDQASARVEEAILGADPLVRVKPLQGEGMETGQWAADALSSERVLNTYIRRESGLDRLLPVLCHRTTKLGTAVVRPAWKRRKWVSRWYKQDGTEAEEKQESGSINFELIDNRAVILWPPTVVNWQDAEMLGHRARYSHYKWKAKAKELELSAEVIGKVEASDQSDTRNADGMVEALDDTRGPKQITELWCDMPLPGDSENTRFLVLLHEDSRTLLKIFPNRHREQQHPYFPLRFKLTDKSGWGDGIGDEALTAQSIESALRTLELDNLMAGAYWVNVVRSGSLADINIDRLRPGEVLRTDDPSDITPIKMGGEAPEVGAAIDKNRFYGREATGMAAVLGGQGDPTMKSGAGTGSTLALIEQAATKFNGVGRRIKFDLADIFSFALDLLAQYATDGQLYRVATKEDAGAIQLLKWLPPRARIRDIFHVEVQAPSASTSNEARKQSYLMLWSFSSQFVQMIVGQAAPVLQQQNPNGYMRWLSEWATFLEELARKIVEHHDLPGLKEMVPSLPEMTPDDQIIQQLQGELQRVMGENEQVKAALQQAEAQAQAAGMGMGMGAPPMAAPPPPQGPQGIVGGYGG